MTQLTVLITDTNIWIDLKIGGILDAVSRLPYNWLIPDLAKEELVKQVAWNQLLGLGVKEGELSGQQLIELIQIRSTSPGLSAPDAAAFILARDHQAILLTGEERLRKLAINHNIPVHGLLWLLDEMIRTSVLDSKQAHTALIAITAQNPRLPKEECQKRLTRWGDG